MSSVPLSDTEPDADDDVLTGTIVDLDVSEEWIAEIAAGPRQARRSARAPYR